MAKNAEMKKSKVLDRSSQSEHLQVEAGEGSPREVGFELSFQGTTSKEKKQRALNTDGMMNKNHLLKEKRTTFNTSFYREKFETQNG